MKKINKKAQITLFIILGIILLGGATFIFYLNSNSQKVDKNVGTDVTALSEYVEGCLKSSLEKNLVLLGKQGGLLYKSQGGLFDDFSLSQKGFFYVDANSKRVSYLIDRPFGNNGYYFTLGRNYPWKIFPYTSLQTKEESYSGYFGRSNLMPLRKPFSHSFQGQLESSILKDLQECSLTLFENQFEIKTKEPLITVSFTNTTLVKLNYPLEIRDRKNGATKKINEFIVHLPINMNGIYFFVSSLIQQDIQNITYDISKTTSNDFTVNVIRDIENKDDLIIIKSKKYKIKNKPYLFQFARHNRQPTISFIDISSNPLSNNSVVDESTLNLNYFDPDEDEINAEYLVKDTDVLPYVITDEDICTNPDFFKILIRINDGQYFDNQTISLNDNTLSFDNAGC